MYDARDLRAAIAIGREPGALVIWSWPKGEMALYRHLRTLNLVQIPNEAKAEAEAEGEDVSDMPSFETVLFRHWDPNVLGGLLPLLDRPQQARFLGAATGLAFQPPDGAGPFAAARPLGLPLPAPGMLRFSPEQIAGVTAGRMHASRLKVLRYLEEVDPGSLDGLPSQARLQRAMDYERSGDAHGLVSESAHMKWAYLNSISDGEIARSPETMDFFRHRTDHPDVVINVLLDELDRVWSIARR
jgi:hypothetical protein